MFTLPKRISNSPLGHSADVSLFLHVDGQVISLSQTGSSALRLATDVAVPSGPARVEIITDGVSHLSDVTVISRRNNSLWLDIV